MKKERITLINNKQVKYIALDVKKYSENQNPEISGTFDCRIMFQLIVQYVIAKKINLL